MRDDNDRDRAAAPPGAIQSHGEDAARGYAIGEVAPRPLNPTEEMERIRIDDPRWLPKPRGGERKGSGPRNPEQKAPLSDKDSGVTMPAGLPVTKMQPIAVDSELLMQWREERREVEAGAAAAANAESKTTQKEESRTIAPVVVNAPQRERRGRAVGIVALIAVAAIAATGAWRSEVAGGEARRATPAVTETPPASAAAKADASGADAGAAAATDAGAAAATDAGAAAAAAAGAGAATATPQVKATASREIPRPRAASPRQPAAPAVQRPAAAASKEPAAPAPPPAPTAPPEFFRPEETQ